MADVYQLVELIGGWRKKTGIFFLEDIQLKIIIKLYLKNGINISGCWKLENEIAGEDSV